MRPRCSNRRRQALTQFEVFLITVIIGAFLGLVIPAIIRARAQAPKVTSINHPIQIAR